jgi:prepilin-type processing-associated H-X9-DG protein
MQVYATNSEMMKLVVSGNTWVLWQMMSNELATPKILHCPDDLQRTEATAFTNFSDVNISYFFNLDASDNYPQMILDGDDNLTVNGVRVPRGILNLRTNVSVAWTKDRHQGTGNLGMADGSVQQATISGLSSALANSGSVTNRLVIP